MLLLQHACKEPIASLLLLPGFAVVVTILRNNVSSVVVNVLLNFSVHMYCTCMRAYGHADRRAGRQYSRLAILQA